MPALEPASDADPRSDADLMAAIRAGDTDAIDELYRRHHRAALSFAESIAGRTLAPDLVSDAFVRIIDLLQRGGGPSLVFRSYLYTTVRNLYIDHIRHHSRQTSVPDFGPLDAEFALDDGLDDRFEHSLVKKAFASLPQRWQVALWYTTVEGVSLEDAGTFLGVAPNAVAALTFRAREGLRQAYLAEHLNLASEQSCAAVLEVLPKYVRGGLRARMRDTVEDHLPECRQCSTAALELGEVNSNLRAVLVVALLGASTAGYLDRALGQPLTPPAPAGAHAFAFGRLGRIAATVGSAAAVGVLVLAWPHHDAPRAESGHRADLPGLAEPNRSSSTPATTPDHQGVPSPLARSAAEAQPAGYQASPPAPATASVVLGSSSWARLTSSSPSWFHLDVPITAPVADAGQMTLEISASSWSAYHVHREAGFGPWECAAATPTRLTCQLPAGANTFDLGLDVQSSRSVVVHVSVGRSGRESAAIDLAVG